MYVSMYVCMYENIHIYIHIRSVNDPYCVVLNTTQKSWGGCIHFRVPNIGGISNLKEWVISSVNQTCLAGKCVWHVWLPKGKWIRIPFWNPIVNPVKSSLTVVVPIILLDSTWRTSPSWALQGLPRKSPGCLCGKAGLGSTFVRRRRKYVRSIRNGV